MAALCEMISAGLLEKDTNNDILWTWSYPAVSEEQRALFTRKSCLSSGGDVFTPFLYSQHNRNWYYIHTCQVQETDNLPKVTAFSLILYAKDFNPEKYQELCKIFSRQLRKTGSPASMLSGYLSVITKGSCDTDENGKFIVKDYEPRQAYANSKLKGIIEVFGVETILIYTALLLKKRIAVYFPPHSIEDLLQFTRAIPAFAWHRQNWSILHPFVELDEKEIEELKGSNHYVAGFTDATIEGRSDLYDVFVNGPAAQISIAQHAQGALAMGKLHKDIAMFMVKCIEDDGNSEPKMIKDISNKTKELLNNLKSLATEEEDGRSYISLESLKERKMPPATENFLFSLAACEGLVKL